MLLSKHQRVATVLTVSTQGFQHVYLDTLGAEVYHAKHGWETTGTAKYHDEIVTIMRRTLTKLR